MQVSKMYKNLLPVPNATTISMLQHRSYVEATIVLKRSLKSIKDNSTTCLLLVFINLFPSTTCFSKFALCRQAEREQFYFKLTRTMILAILSIVLGI